MHEATNLPAYLFDDKALQMMEQMRRIQEERQQPLETYPELVREVTLTVAVGLNGLDVEMGDVRELAIQRYNHDWQFRYKVSAVTAELMRVFGRYKPA